MDIELMNSLRELKDIIETEAVLGDMINKKQVTLVNKLGSLIAETFQEMINIMVLKYKGNFLEPQRNTKRAKLFFKDSKEYFGEAYVYLSKLLCHIRSNANLLADLLIQAGNYADSLKGEFGSLIESIVNLFFEDFASPGRSRKDFHSFLKCLIQKCVEEKGVDNLEKDVLLSAVISAVLNRREINEYIKELLKGVKIDSEIPTSRSSTIISPTRSIYQMPLNQTVIVGEKPSAIELPWAPKIAKVIWANMTKYLHLMPVSLRYLITALLDSAGEPATEAQIRKILSYVLVTKALDPALNEPYENNLLEDCEIFPSAYKVSLVTNVLRALMEGHAFPTSNHLSAANDFISNSQGEVKDYIKEFLEAKVENNYGGDTEIVQAEGMCLTLANLQLIFDLILHDFGYYYSVYPEIASLIKLLVPYERKGKLFFLNRDFIRQSYPNMKDEEILQASVYLLFTNISIKTSEDKPKKQLTEKDQMIELFRDLLLTVNLTNFVESKGTPAEVLKEFLKSVQENTTLYCDNKTKVRNVRLGADHLLKLAEKGTLQPEFLAELKIIIEKRNQDFQEKLSLFSLHKGRAFKHTHSLLNNWKFEATLAYKTVCVRTSAALFIKSYSSPFVISVDNSSKYHISFCDKTQLPTLASQPSVEKAGERIHEFIDFLLTKDIGKIVSTGEDYCNLRQVYQDYISRISKTIVNESSETAEEILTHDDRQRVYEEVESHIARKIYSKAFIFSPSKPDQVFSTRLRSLKWIQPQQLGINEKALEYGFWQFAAQELKRLEICKTPKSILEVLSETTQIILEGLSKFTSAGKDLGADYSLPSFNYVMLLAQPRILASCLKYYFYISAFAGEMLDFRAYSLTQTKAAMEYLMDGPQPKDLGISKEEFDKKLVEASKEVNNAH